VVKINRKPALPAGAFFSLLTVSLAVVGVGYGLWSKSLRIEGIVNTGRVHARWTLVTCTEFYPWPTGGHSGEFEGKEVGSTTATIDSADPQILHVALANTYPSYAVDCQVHYTNDGSVPVIVRGITLGAASPNLTNCVVDPGQTSTLYCDQLTVSLVDGIGSQIDPGDGMGSSLMVHVEQPAEQEADYDFDVLVCLSQWNEPATMAQCVAAAP
jgi:hypothetical protein